MLLKESFKASEALCDSTLDCVEPFVESTHLHGQIFARLLDSMALNFNLLCHKLQLGLQLGFGLVICENQFSNLLVCDCSSCMPVSKRADRFSTVVLKSPRSARSMGMSVSCFHVCSGFSNPFCAPFQPPACEDVTIF